MNLLVLGPQGAGKGTQAKRISAEFGIPHVSTGDMFRAATAAGTELGRKVKPLLDSGTLVPDDVTIALIRERLSEDDAREGFVLDGFPRNLPQAEALDEMLGSIGRTLDAILFFDISDSVGMERALGRAQHREPHRRHGGSDRASASRTYHSETEPTVEYYRTTGKLVPIRAGRTIEEVWNEISSALHQVARRMIIRKSAAGDRDDGSRRRGRRRDARAPRGAHRGRRLDRRARRARRGVHPLAGGEPTFKGYKGYPAATCLSPNAMVVHGIPGAATLAAGDILSVDVGVTLDGLRRGFRLDVPGRRDRAGDAAAARHLPGGARGGHRRGPDRQVGG